MANKYLLMVDEDPTVICDTIKQAVTYITEDAHLDRVFKDWYEEEMHVYGNIEYLEYIERSIQNGDFIRVEIVPTFDNSTPPKREKKISCL